MTDNCSLAANPVMGIGISPGWYLALKSEHMFLLHEHETNQMAHWFKKHLCENKMQWDLEKILIVQCDF